MPSRGHPIPEARDQSSMVALARGQSLGPRFTLIRPLGQGGMGEVWLVDDRELEENVVVKILAPDSPLGYSEERIALLKRECRSARGLVHPNIVRVYDVHEEDGVRFISMAYIEGNDIGQLRDRPLETILDALLPVAHALDYAHRQGVVHRDLKAANVLLDRNGEPQLLDFGIAGLLDSPAEASEVSGGGSPSSTSPQQRAGSEPSRADDIYAFGALLYDLLSGHPRLPETLTSALSSLLSDDPSDRPADMAEVKATLGLIRKSLVSPASAKAEPQMSAKAPPIVPAKMNLTPPPRVESIRPVDAPTSSTIQPRLSSGGGVGWMTIATFGILILATVGVFVFLPGWIPEQPPSTSLETSAEPRTSTLPREPSESVRTSDLRQEAELKTLAEQGRQAAVRGRDDLQAKSVSIWGGEDYTAAMAALESGDDQLRVREFGPALESYEVAVAGFQSLSSRGAEVLRQALADGQEALDRSDSGAAKAAFELAARVDPNNRTALVGLKRAGVSNDVVNLLARGADHERNGDLDQAATSYKKALSLDSRSQAAKNALGRVERAVTERDFRAAMSAGVSAIHRQDFRSAREAFQRAGSIKPGAAQVAEGLAQAEEGLRLQVIGLHRENAVALESKEDWHKAAEHYEAVLELDATIRFAQEGQKRTSRRAALSDQLDFHIENAERLSDTRVLQIASAVLETASQIEPAGPRLEQQRSALTKVIEDASAIISVQLRSDKKTEVVIYKVGRIGKFEHHTLQLRPGTYTVVGSRPGYRDVRLTLKVETGKSPAPLIVTCKEEI